MDFDALEAAYLSSTIAVFGTVVDDVGAPVDGVVLQAGDVSTRTSSDGRFRLDGLLREQRWLVLSGPLVTREHRPLHLMRALSVSEVDLGAIRLARSDRGVPRLMFAGDAMLGRRFIDPAERSSFDELPPGDDTAWVDASSPLAGSREALRWVQPWLEEADLTAINLESPVISDPRTPHPEKEYVFFTLPDSLPAFVESGVDYVSLGNNHVYDYLEDGIEQTLDAVDGSGLGHSGAGSDLDEAYLPWVTTLGEQEVGLVSASSISGSHWDPGFHATDTKGGSADAYARSDLEAAIASAKDGGGVAIAQLHMGLEYSLVPSASAREQCARAREAGASLCVGHHPHTAQGFSYDEGVLSAWSLGNFLFDSDRLETMLGLGLRVDLNGDALEAAYALPIYIEDYRPRPAVGAVAERLLRRIGESSVADGVWVVPEAGLGWLATSVSGVKIEERTVQVQVSIGADRRGFVDLRQHAEPDESLVRASLGVPLATAALGRDLLLFGDMEDADVDEDWGEVTRIDASYESIRACSAARRDARAACLLRAHGDVDRSVLVFRQRIRFSEDDAGDPVRDLTLFAWTRAEGAGEVSASVRWMASEGDEAMGEDAVWSRDGSWEWSRLRVDLDPPQRSEAVRVFFEQAPPWDAADTGLLVVDDVAVVAWEGPQMDLDGLDTLQAPHARDFLRIDGPPGEHTLEVTLARLRRAY